LSFLHRDYRLVVAAHVRVGFLPPETDLALFAQVLRAVGVPVLDRLIAEISMARLPMQLFKVTA